MPRAKDAPVSSDATKAKAPKEKEPGVGSTSATAAGGDAASSGRKTPSPSHDDLKV